MTFERALHIAFPLRTSVDPPDDAAYETRCDRCAHEVSACVCVQAVLDAERADPLVVAAKLALAYLEDEQTSSSYCEMCNEVAPMVGDVVIHDVVHLPDCPYFALKEALAGVR